MRLALASVLSALALLATPALAQDLTMEGNWQTSDGQSRFAVSYCGENLRLCATLTELGPQLQTRENLIWLNQRVIEAERTGPNTWEGEVVFDGQRTQGRVTLTSANTLSVNGCRGALCDSFDFVRLDNSTAPPF